jgi:hypothetical protein
MIVIRARSANRMMSSPVAAWQRHVLLFIHVPKLVPEAGLEPARPRGRGIFVPLRLSPPACAVRGLEHAFAVASRP